MKTLILLLSISLASRLVSAQTPLEVAFQNLGVGLNAPVYNVDTVTPLAGSGFRAELVYDATPLGGDARTAVAPDVGFASGGYFFGSTRSIEGFTVSSEVSLYVRAWDVASGASYDAATIRGISDEITLTVPAVTEPPSTPQLLVGMTSFSIQAIPEPQHFGLAITLVLASVAARRKMAVPGFR